MIEYTVQVDETYTRWLHDGFLHREDGPAVEFTNGDKQWWIKGKLHREDGPAIEGGNGDKYWYRNDKLHRTDGPAIEPNSPHRLPLWYLNDKIYTEDAWKKAINGLNSPSCNGKIVEIDGKKYKLKEISQ